MSRARPIESEARERAIAEAQQLYDEGKVSLLEATFIADALTAEYEADESDLMPLDRA